MMEGVKVKFEDYSKSSGYTFRPMHTFSDNWPVVPRVGETVLDAHEFQYEVKRVVWWSPYEVTLVVEKTNRNTI